MPVYPDKLLLSPPVLATLAVLLATARLYNAALDSLFLLYLTAGSIVLRLVFRYAGLFLLVLFCVSLLAGSWYVGNHFNDLTRGHAYSSYVQPALYLWSLSASYFKYRATYFRR